MEDKQHRKIIADPEFQALCRRKTRFGVLLTIIVFVSTIGLLLLMPLAPKFLGTALFGFRAMSVGVLWGSFLIIGAIVVTGIYVWFANGKMQQLEDSVRRRLVDEG
jgi:uncharacterized membrane protein (DUF485 family)